MTPSTSSPDTSRQAKQDPTNPNGQTLCTLALLSGSVAAGKAEVQPPLGQTLEPTPDRDSGHVPPVVALSALKAGDRLDKYLIVDALGQGGMGIVFKARDTVLDRIVAIKVLTAHRIHNPAARERFIQEGRAAAAIRDQHVVTVYGVEGHESTPYLVLEYVEGRSLQDLLAESAPLPPEEVVRLGTQIAQGLAAAHRKGVVHRDIKPANILLEHGTGRVAITDFGLARAATDPGARSGEFCGTPHYMAPEQVCGGALDHRADLFSLGGVLYYMCTGELPFAAPNAVAVLHRVTQDQPRPVAECNPHVPAWLADLIAALHAKEPDRRIQTAAEVKERLLARDGAPSATHVLRPSARPAEAPDQGHGRRRPAFALLLLGAAFLLSLPAFYLLLPQDKSAGAKEHPREPAVTETKRPKAPSEERPRPAQPPQRRDVVVVAPRLPIPQPLTRHREKSRPRRPSSALKGIVIVQVYDMPSQTFFREEGLSARHLKTARVVTLEQGRNELALGEYRLVLPRTPAGISISPRQFTVSAVRSTLISVAQSKPRETPLPPPDGVDFPPGLPPPPPGLPFPPRPRR